MRFLYIPLLLSTFLYGVATERPFKLVRAMLKLDPSSIEDAQDDPIVYIRKGEKRFDLKPKYDPGWKFIGLGKRPRHIASFSGEEARMNPLLTISSIINFEMFNAIRDAAVNDPKSNRLSSRQMYDPGWMLTGLGK